MQQTFGVINHYIQDEGCGHDIICALWPVNSGENTAESPNSLLLSIWKFREYERGPHILLIRIIVM